MPQRRVDCYLTLRRQAFQLLISAPQLLPLLWAQLGEELHALQSLSAFFRRKAVKVFQALTKCRLSIGWKLFESGFAFQQFELLVQRKVFMRLEPVAHLVSVFLC